MLHGGAFGLVSHHSSQEKQSSHHSGVLHKDGSSASMHTMDSFGREIKRNHAGHVDYDKKADPEEIQYLSGAKFHGGIAVRVEPDETLYEPKQADIEFNEYSWNQGVNQLSYSKVKRHQYKMHPRDRQNKEKIAPFGAEISFLPVSACQI